MSPLTLVGILVIASSTLADVKHVLEGSAHPPDPNAISPQAVNYLESSPPNGQYWWMGANSPLKAAYDYYKKCNAKGNCVAPVNPSAPAPQPFRPSDTISIDIKKNPFLSGNFNPQGGNAAYNEGNGKIDISKNPFLSGKVVTAGNGVPVKDEQGFLGVQPAQPFGKKPGFATTHPLEQKKKPGFATTHPLGQQRQPGLLNLTVECKGAGFVCVEKELCLNGVVNKNGEGLLQTRSDVHYCEENKEVCCQLNNLNEITAGKSSIPESTIKFAGGAGFSPGLIHVQPLNVKPEIIFGGEHGHHSSATSKSIRDTSIGPNSVFSSTVDYSDTKFDDDVRFASTFQGPAYLPPVGPTSPAPKPFETRQPSINQQYFPSRSSTPQYVPPSSTTPRPTSPTYQPTPSTYEPVPSSTFRPAPTTTFQSTTFRPAVSTIFTPAPPVTFRPAPTTSREYLPPRSSTPRPTSIVTQYVPPQQPYQPSVTPQQPYQPSVTPQKPYQPSITPQQPYQPSVTPQKPYQPSITTQKPYKPSFTPQQPYQPSVTPQKPYQPSITTQQPYQPSITPQQPCQPGVTSLQCQPGVTPQKPYQPTFTPQQPYQPSITTQQPYQPSITPQQPCQPGVTSLQCQPGVTPQKPYQPTITPQQPYQPSVTTQRPYQPSFTPQQPCQPGTTSQQPYQPGIITQQCQPTVTPQKPYQPSITTQRPYQPSITPQQPYQPSVTPQQPYRPSVTPQQPYRPSVTPQQPYQPSVTPQQPYQPSITPQQPYQPSVTPQRPYQPSVTPQKPYQPSPTTIRPYQPYQPSTSKPTTSREYLPPRVSSPVVPQPSSVRPNPFIPQQTTSRPTYQPQPQPTPSPQYPSPSVQYPTPTFPQSQPTPRPQYPSPSVQYPTPAFPQSKPTLSPRYPSPSVQYPTPTFPQSQPTPRPQYTQPGGTPTGGYSYPTPAPSSPQPRPTPPPFRPTPSIPKFPSTNPPRPTIPEVTGYEYPTPSSLRPNPFIPQQQTPSRPGPSITNPPYVGSSTNYISPSTTSRPVVTQPPYQPSTQPPYQPSTQPPYQPSTQQPYQPSTQRPYQPSTQQPYEPSTQRPYQPSPQQPYQPSTQRPFVPQQTTANPNPAGGYEYPKPTPTFGYPSSSPRQDFSNSNVNNQYVPPPKKPGENPDQSFGAANVNDAYVRPTSPRTPPFQGELNTAPPPGCAAALKCVQEIYCTAEGVVSPVPVVLTKEQELARVPTTICQDTESGIIGKCCRDPNYKDPWPSANLVNGIDDGQYKEDDSIGQYQPDLQRNVRSQTGGPRQDLSNNGNTAIQPIPQAAQPTCGERHLKTNPPGPGPIDANFAEIPWQAMVLRDSNRSLLCGGAIIRRDAVLTAAHCVDGLETNDILIKGGEWKLGIDEEPLPFQIVKVSVVVKHPQYQKGSFVNDLALLILEEKLRPSKNIGTLCLPPPNQIPTQNCIATGWGKRILQLHARGAIMHAIDVKIMDNQQCQETLSSTFQHASSHYSPNTLCGYSNIDQCKVDYGSALACSDGNKYTLSGIFAWDTGCKQKGQIGGYIAPDVEWIESTLAKPIRELKKLEQHN